MRYRVQFWVNEVAGTGNMLMTEDFEIIESDKLTEEELREDFRSQLCRLYRVSPSDIKIGSVSEV